MIVLFIKPAAQQQHYHRIKGTKQMKAKKRNGVFNDNLTEVADIYIHWVQVE